MPKTVFQKNRVAVLNSLFEQGYFKKIITADPIIIEELEVASGKLRKLSLINFPISANTECNVYEIFLEKKKTIHSFPEGFKMAERAILIVTCCSFYILIIEMKNSLRPYLPGKDGHIESIRKKFEDTIGKIRILLTLFLVDSFEYDIFFKSFIVYNNDLLSRQVEEDPSLKSNPFYKIQQY